MKALRRKDSKEWLTEITASGKLYTGNIPLGVTDNMKSVQQVEDTENAFRSTSIKIDLSDYELVTIKIVVDE